MFRTEFPLVPRLFSVARLAPKSTADLSTFFLRPLPAPPSPSLSWIAAAFDALSAAYSDVAALLSTPTDAALAAAYFDHTARVLDLCNAVSAEIEKLRRRRLLLRFALHLLRPAGPRTPETLLRASDSLREFEALEEGGKPGGLAQSAAALAADLNRRRTPPRGKVSVEGRRLWRTIASLDLLAASVAAAAAAILTGEVPAEVPPAGSEWPLAGEWWRSAEEVAAMEAAAKGVAGALGKETEDDGDWTEVVDDAVRKLETAKDKCSEAMERLHDGVKGLFNAVVGSRSVLLGSYRTYLADPSALRNRKHVKEIL